MGWDILSYLISICRLLTFNFLCTLNSWVWFQNNKEGSFEFLNAHILCVLVLSFRLELKKVNLLIFRLWEAESFGRYAGIFSLFQYIHSFSTTIAALSGIKSLFFRWTVAALVLRETEVLCKSVCLYSSAGRGTGMCLHRPAAAVGGGANGRRRRSDLAREHYCQMCQGQPLLWPVGEKPPRRGATCEARYETFDVIIANGSVVDGNTLV